MKKFTHLLIAAAALGMMVACTGNKGYVITGTVEGAADGDTVYLQKLDGRNYVKLDSSIIKNGTFTFEGKQDTAVNRFITSNAQGEPLFMDFFLENGKINVSLTKNNDSATGSENNDIYQPIRAMINDYSNQFKAIYDFMGDSTATAEQKEAKQKEGNDLEDKYIASIKEAATKNITNPVGVYLFKQIYFNNSTDENAALIEQIPVNLQNDETIIRIKEVIEKQKKTAVGTKYIDFEMKDPNGKSVKLSDYVGKGKVVLVDFWASWCGPCRQEMPNIVALYDQYKGKNFEIVGVSLDKDEAAWKESIKNMNMTWPQMSDLKYWQNEGAQLYAVNSIPHTVLIGPDGTILARGLHGQALKDKIAEVVK